MKTTKQFHPTNFYKTVFILEPFSKLLFNQRNAKNNTQLIEQSPFQLGHRRHPGRAEQFGGGVEVSVSPGFPGFKAIF